MVPDRGRGGHWRFVVAAIGCLTFHSMLSPALVEARVPELPINQRGAVQSPTPVANANAGNSATSADADNLSSTTINQGESQSAACHEQCTAAEQREIEDLVAQRASARAAQDMVALGWWQVGLGFIGTIAVTGALILSAVATRAAVEANRIARDNYVADQRPIIYISGQLEGGLKFAGAKCDIVIGIDLVNLGKAPAEHVSTWTKMKIIDFRQRPTLVNLSASDVEVDERRKQNLFDVTVLPNYPENILHWAQLDISEFRVTPARVVDPECILVLLLEIFACYPDLRDGSLYITSQNYIVNLRGDRKLRPDEDGSIPLADMFLAKGRRTFRVRKPSSRKQDARLSS